MLEFFVIMDKDKKAIACGSPRNRSMRTLESVQRKPVRILMYGTEGRARSAYSDGLGFYDETDGYLRDKYPNMKDYESVCIPVKVTITFS